MSFKLMPNSGVLGSFAWFLLMRPSFFRVQGLSPSLPLGFPLVNFDIHHLGLPYEKWYFQNFNFFLSLFSLS